MYCIKGRNWLNFPFYDILECDKYPTEIRNPLETFLVNLGSIRKKLTRDPKI